MARYTTQDIRNLSFVGHGSSGKTTLADSILHKTGVSNRFGRVNDGTSLLDWTDDEKDRKHTIDPSVVHTSAHGCEFNIIDTPGYPDFMGAAIPSLSAVETAVLVVEAGNIFPVNARSMWGETEKRQIARMVVVNKMDHDNASFEKSYATVREKMGNRCIAVTLPVGEGPSFGGVISVLDGGAEEMADQREEVLSELMDAIAETSEELMDRYLEAGELSPEDISEGLKQAVVSGGIVPVFFMSADKEIGVEEFLAFAARACPSPLDTPQRTDHTGEHTCSPDPALPLIAHAWRRSFDPFVSRITFLRILQGTMKIDGIRVLHGEQADDDKFTGMFRIQGREQEKVESAIPGDIVALAKAEKISFGDTVTQRHGGKNLDESFVLGEIEVPQPMVSLAVHSIKREDDQKLKPALTRIAEDDPTFRVEVSNLTQEMVISGLSELHMGVMLARIKARDKLEVTTTIPLIPYLETIAGTAEQAYRHKKQTGGAGEFAEVHIRLRPQERGEGFSFVDKIVGGAISKSYIPSVEKGIKSVCDGGGVVAGFPVVDVAVELYDGKEHPVDSKDVAFQKAGRMAFRQAMSSAKPALLEPIYNVEIDVPIKFSGDILGDLAGQRRGRPQGMEQTGDRQVISAQVPLAEIQTYATDLRSVTGGDGTYSISFSHYEICPAHIQGEVAARYGKKAAEED